MKKGRPEGLGKQESLFHLSLLDLCRVRILLEAILLGEVLALVLVLSRTLLPGSGNVFTSLVLYSLLIQLISLSSIAVLCRFRSQLSSLPGWGQLLSILVVVVSTSALMSWAAYALYFELFPYQGPHYSAFRFVLVVVGISTVSALLWLRYGTRERLEPGISTESQQVVNSVEEPTLTVKSGREIRRLPLSQVCYFASEHK
ncbi:MAG: hypothetical protein HUJ30_07630, partial [Gammaproteobacteria bacterium]|nr:hypothetical protein [Gammaproteobacteria bacterium]